MEYYALEYETKTAIRITQSHIVRTKTHDSPGRQGEGKPSMLRPSLAYDDGGKPLGERKYEIQTLDSERPAWAQRMPARPWNMSGSPYNQASLAYRHAQMLMDEGIDHFLDIWA